MSKNGTHRLQPESPFSDAPMAEHFQHQLLLRVPSHTPSTLESVKKSSLYLSCSSPTLSTSSSTTANTDIESYSPGILYARSFQANIFDRPASARSCPTGRFRKNMKDITGYGTTEEEFDALPIAVRRKYFSTLERLRFAQSSRNTALDELPIQSHRKSTLADRRGVNLGLIEPRRKPAIARRNHKVRQSSVSSNDASWFLTMPEKIKKTKFTREEQVILAANLRESVILDAADEAVYKASRRASRNLTSLSNFSSPSTLNNIMDSEKNIKKEESTSPYAAEMYENFRWMDDEQDLDLKLTLDDYHANLNGAVVPTPASNRRPSFRRQLSITKIPFGRTSMSSNHPRSPSILEKPTSLHMRQRSRALSLIGPKHMAKNSVASIDPNAAHYQDPEARLKLRVYLASPQKFDEAIEFGFPSINGVTESGADKENKPPNRTSKDMKKSFSTEKSFLNDDAGSLFEDDVSMVDPDSPLTPLGEIGFRSQRATPSTQTGTTPSDFSHLGITKPTLVKQADPYAHAMAGNREMTLRMTLTRPDLRADESTIYGWQNQNVKTPVKEEPLPEEAEKSEMVKGPFGGLDGWGPPDDDKEEGVVKRFWNKVKSTQKKTS